MAGLEEKIVNKIGDSIGLVDKGIKAEFTIEGRKFWISRGRGAYRLQSIARRMLGACESDSNGVVSGQYDDLFTQLIDNTTYSPEDGEPVPFHSGGYDSFMTKLSEEDPQAAMDLHIDMPYAVAVACLGKLLLRSIIIVPQDSDLKTSPESSEQNQERLEEGNKSAKKTSKSPAQGFQVQV